MCVLCLPTGWQKGQTEKTADDKLRRGIVSTDKLADGQTKLRNRHRTDPYGQTYRGTERAEQTGRTLNEVVVSPSYLNKQVEIRIVKKATAEKDER